MSAERLARAALTAAAEPDDRAVRELVAERGAVAAWSALREASRSLPSDVRERLAARAAQVDPHRDLAALAAVGGRLVCPGEPEWPATLDGLDTEAPFALWVRGTAELAACAEHAVAVVGSRAATEYGAVVASELASDLAEQGWTVVSGGAYGIDAAAHRGALAVGGPTVAVLACGVDVSYPRGHRGLFQRIAERGLLVSEWPPGVGTRRHRFLVRNRIIAGLAAGTVVVQAAARSGALSTANWADRFSRPVMGVPGAVTNPMSAGVHQLLRDGATVVTSAADVLEEVSPLGLVLVTEHPLAPRELDGLDPVTSRVVEALSTRRAMSVDEVSCAAGLTARDVLRAMPRLLSRDLATEDLGGYRRIPPRGGA